MAATTIDLLQKLEKLEEAKKEQKERIGNKKYRSPIPKNIKLPKNPWEK